MSGVIIVLSEDQALREQAESLVDRRRREISAYARHWQRQFGPGTVVIDLNDGPLKDQLRWARLADLERTQAPFNGDVLRGLITRAELGSQVTVVILHEIDGGEGLASAFNIELAGAEVLPPVAGEDGIPATEELGTAQIAALEAMLQAEDTAFLDRHRTQAINFKWWHPGKGVVLADLTGRAVDVGDFRWLPVGELQQLPPPFGGPKVVNLVEGTPTRSFILMIIHEGRLITIQQVDK